MSLLIYAEEYHGSNFLSSNVGDWVETAFEFIHRVDYSAEYNQNKIIWRMVGGVFWFELTNGNEWSDYGFVGGKNIDIKVTVIGAAVSTVSSVIQYIDGDKIFLTTDPFTGSFDDGTFSPNFSDTTGQLESFFEITQTSAPEALEYDFNLANIDNPSLNSLIDGGINRFKYTELDTLPILGASFVMSPVANRSGGYFSEPRIRYISNVDGYRKYRITFFFFVWPLIQDNQNEPQWFNGVDTVGPNNRVRVFSQLNNSNSILEDKSANTDGNVGGFNENYNTSVNPYTVNNVIFTDASANVIEGIDYCNTTHVTATITGSTFDPANSKFNVGLVWRSNDADNYQNKLTNLGQNLMVAAPIQEFIDSATPDPSTYNGNNEPTTGAGWAFTNVQFSLVGTQLTFEADILPDAPNEVFFNALDDGAKRCTLWISHNRTDLPATDRDRTSIKLYDTDVICAPAVGDPINVLSEAFTDHGDIDLSTATTTTEDDVLYSMDFLLNNGDEYNGLRASIQMYNLSTEEFFTLEEFFIGFTSVPFINGIYEANEAINRNFNLPPATDKNQITLNRLPGSDIVGAYGMRLEYGFENLWRYWDFQSNADNDFFDLAQPNNGLNKNWQRYSSDPNWTIRMATFMVRDVDDFNYSSFVIRDYDDEDVTTTCTFIDLSDLSTPTALIANTLIEVTAVLTWNTGVFDPLNNWFSSTIEDFEAGNRWLLSSVLSQGGISSNPLKPITGQTMLDVSIVGNVATLKYIIDTNIVDASKVSLTHRVWTLSGIDGKIMEDGTQKIMELGTNKQLET